jgi:heme A synthase
MKKIALMTALFSTIGGAAALAQGAPPGLAPWHSTYGAYEQQVQAMNAHKAEQNRLAARTHRNAGAPTAGEGQGFNYGG